MTRPTKTSAIPANSFPHTNEPYEDEELSVQEAEELIRGHRVICTCAEDPDWCEKHNSFA